MQVKSSAATDVGRHRAHNEDSYYVDDEVGLFAVADGVGGAAAGEMASRLFCEVLAEHREAFRRGLERSGSDPEVRQELLGLMERVFQRASERIYRLGDRESKYRGMATT
ncbi:MAG: serine/threonine protein phosphatase PrpC, partial [Myxococcota bacterium]